MSAEQREAREAGAAPAKQLGGKVVVAPNRLDDGTVVAYVTDPDGSMFALSSSAPDR